MSLSEPPALPTPELGQEVPVADPEHTCPLCGAARVVWYYHPLSRCSRRGWVLRRVVCCPATDARAVHDRPVAPSVRTLSQPELDREFVQASVRGQTFLTLHLNPRPRLAPVYEALQRYAHAFRPGETQSGVFLAGVAGSGKTALIHCLINHARALGVPALSLSLTQLLDLTIPERGETEEQQEDRQDRRRILRQVPVLAVRDLARHALTGPAIQELSLLLEQREARGLVTHFTGTETPARLRDHHDWGSDQEAIAALTQRLERLCGLILTCKRAAATGPAGRPRQEPNSALLVPAATHPPPEPAGAAVLGGAAPG